MGLKPAFSSTVKKAAEASYTMIYQTGGTETAKWHRTLLVGTLEQMNVARAVQHLAGRNAYTKTLRELESIGMPEGYKALEPRQIEEARRLLAEYGDPHIEETEMPW